MTRGLGQIPNFYTEIAERKYLKGESKKINNYQFYNVRKNSDKILCIYDLHNVQQIHQYTEAGSSIGGIDEWGKGYGSEVWKMICDFVLNIINLNTIVVRVFSFNFGSIKSAENVGFKKVGEISNRYYYRGKFYNEIILEITKEEFYKRYNSFVLPLPDKK